MMNFEIPDGLGDMLRDFTVAVLRQRPHDLYDFSVDYFTRARDSKRAKKVPMYIIVDDDEDAGEPDPESVRPRTQKQTRFGRRPSVSAEPYDPEAEDPTKPAMHPKTDDQRQRLTEAVGGILIFRSLESEQMQEVIDAMFEKHVEPGEPVIKQKEAGDNFYVIESGMFDVLVTTDSGEKKVHQFQDKGSFGELALMYNQPRSASVFAASAGTLWAMDRRSFRSIVLNSAFKKRKMYEQLLKNVPILSSLEDYERRSLGDALTSKSYAANTCIIKQGDDADGMYFVESGSVRVTITTSGREKNVSTLEGGKYFGEMALVENQPRSASVFAATKLKLAFLERESFERLLGPCLDIMKRNIQEYERGSS